MFRPSRVILLVTVKVVPLILKSSGLDDVTRNEKEGRALLPIEIRKELVLRCQRSKIHPSQSMYRSDRDKEKEQLR